MKYGIMFLSVFVSAGVLWLITGLQFNRIRIKFLKQYPKEAKLYVTPVGHRSPKNITFLFKDKSVSVLKKYPELWKIRQVAVFLFFTSIVYPVLWMIIFAIIATVSS